MAHTDEQPQRSAEFAQLPTEARNLKSEHIDELSTIDMLRVINEEDATVAVAVQHVLPQIAQAVDAIVERFKEGGRLFYLGAGTSGRLGVLDASECPPTFSVPSGLFVGLIAGGDRALRDASEGNEDSAAEGSGDLATYHINAHDTVLGIAASGRTPYVLGALAYASTRGALTVALTCAGGAGFPSPAAQAANVAIEVATGAEVLTGSTRLKAGTATKLVLNMISTGVMIRSGAVYGNLMVNVQTTNAKLRSRAVGIVAAVAGCDLAAATDLLERAGGVKVAIAMRVLQVDRATAEARLLSCDANVRRALQTG